MRVVQCIITLLPDGSLAAELPSLNGARRQVPVDSLETVRRILAAQLHNRADTIGTDGKPTIAQVKHWEEHLERIVDDATGTYKISKLQPDTCVWCLAHTMGLSTDERAHRRARAILREQRRIQAAPYKMGDGSVTVKRIPAQDKRIIRKGKKEEPTINLGLDDIDFSDA
jgi:hypothetical protein